MPQREKLSKFKESLSKLASHAADLNTASDELGKAVASLDKSLKILNVGLSVWIDFRNRRFEESQMFEADQIGYTRVNGTWGISIRKFSGDETGDDCEIDGPWLFNDAPRDLRIRSVDKLADVIEGLGNAASRTAKEVREKAQEVRDLAAAIGEPDAIPVVDGLTLPQVNNIFSQLGATEIGERVRHAYRWELLGSSDLIIHFRNQKHAYAEIINTPNVLALIKDAAYRALKIPVNISVRVTGNEVRK